MHKVSTTLKTTASITRRGSVGEMEDAMNSTQLGVISEKRQGLVEVSRSCPERIYVELRLPEDAYFVHKVIFRTLSHDQGG
jgi:hypothetical protein